MRNKVRLVITDDNSEMLQATVYIYNAETFDEKSLPKYFGSKIYIFDFNNVAEAKEYFEFCQVVACFREGYMALSELQTKTLKEAIEKFPELLYEGHCRQMIYLDKAGE